MKGSVERIFIVIVIAILLFSCGEYEDGPCISFWSREKRIEGGWEVQ